VAEASDTQRPASVTVIIPTHNRREKLLECLSQVVCLDGATIIPVVVFDGCTDGSVEAVALEFPSVIRVLGDGNLWWSGAIDAGIEAAQALNADYYCLLNDDVIPDIHMVKALLQAEKSNRGALIGSMICFLRDRERIWCAGGYSNWLGSGVTMRGNGGKIGPEWEEIAEVQWLPGMGTLISRDVIERIGNMDQLAFPQYFGDTDFSLRAHRAGIRVMVCPDAVLYNDVESTGVLLPSGAITWAIARNVLFSMRSHANMKIRLRFWLRHCPLPLVPWQVTRFYLPLFAVITKKMTWDRLPWSRKSLT